MLLWAREGDTASQYSSGVRTAVQMQYLLTYLQALDLRWSSCQLVSDTEAERSLCLAAVDECRNLSVGPTFIVSQQPVPV